MTFVVWIAIGLAAVIFVIFAGWPLYNTYKTRGQGADVAEAQAYFKAKAETRAIRDRTRSAVAGGFFRHRPAGGISPGHPTIPRPTMIGGFWRWPGNSNLLSP